MKEVIPYLFAILAGIFTTLEACINSNLGRIVSPKIATLHSLLTGFLVILTANILSGSLYEYTRVFHVRLRWLIGGLFGALIVYLITKTIPKLGITATLTVVIASQILSGFFIDTFIFKHVKLEISKAFGAILVLIGVYFIVE